MHAAFEPAGQTAQHFDKVEPVAPIAPRTVLHAATLANYKVEATDMRYAA
jgi:hypothetical protein